MLLLQETMMSRIETFFPSLGATHEKVDARNPSATKKGPGRIHMQGKIKDTPKRPSYKLAVNAKVKVKQQTDNVANTPLKSATRGG